MAIDIKDLFVDALIELSKEKKLEKITIKDLLVRTGASRQTFYNHFVDKNDLIQCFYNTKIINDFNDQYELVSFRESLMKTFINIKEYHSLMKQACLLEGQNNLRDYIMNHCQEFDLNWHQRLYGEEPMSEALRFATIYHATASSSMTLSWILSDMPVECHEIVDMIVEMRNLGMKSLFKTTEENHPYSRQS